MFVCSFCDFSSKEKCYLERHVYGVHDKSQDFHCALCDYSTYDTFKLDKYVKYVSRNQVPEQNDLSSNSNAHGEHFKAKPKWSESTTIYFFVDSCIEKAH